MGTWFWLNIPLALLFFGCWAGIPLWHMLHRWHDEISAKHAEIAARAVVVPVPVRPEPVATAMDEIGTRSFAGVASE